MEKEYVEEHLKQISFVKAEGKPKFKSFKQDLRMKMRGTDELPFLLLLMIPTLKQREAEY